MSYDDRINWLAHYTGKRLFAQRHLAAPALALCTTDYHLAFSALVTAVSKKNSEAVLTMTLFSPLVRLWSHGFTWFGHEKVMEFDCTLSADTLACFDWNFILTEALICFCLIQCVTTTGSGACSDELSQPAGTNDVTVGDYSNQNGIITISYTRPLDTNDANGDKVIPTGEPTYVSWAIGPINPDGLAARHRQQPAEDVQVNFGQVGFYLDIHIQ